MEFLFVLGMALGAFTGAWISAPRLFPTQTKKGRLQYATLVAVVNGVVFAMVALIF